MNRGYREGGWKTTVVNKIAYGWQAGWLFQDLWQFCFVRENVPGMWLAAVALIGALTAFQVTLHRLNGTTHELRDRGYTAMPAVAYVFYKLPTAVNAAWLSVATALGLLIVPVAYGVEQARLVAPAAVLTVVVTAGGAWRLIRHRDAAYGITLIWALSAVAANKSGNVPQAVKVVGIVCLAVLALLVVSALVRIRRQLSAAANPEDADVRSLLSYNSYGNQRILLSDSDAFAGDGRGPGGSFSFPTVAGGGFHAGEFGSANRDGNGYAASGPAAADGLVSDTSSGRRAAAPGTTAAAALRAAGGGGGGGFGAGLGASASLGRQPQQAQQQQQQQFFAGAAQGGGVGVPGGSRRGSLNGASTGAGPAGPAAGGGGGGAVGVGGGTRAPSLEPTVRDGVGALAGGGGGGGANGAARRVRFDDEEQGLGVK